jgi:hypothetical protein|tara:strand:- start:1256 stop:1450 length:195 start_codon:yes stop_codon:yes gene_type:complete
MSNCAHCNRQFTCGCQKATVEGVAVCKTCVTNYKAKRNNSADSDPTRTRGLELARQQIVDLRNK